MIDLFYKKLSIHRATIQETENQAYDAIKNNLSSKEELLKMLIDSVNIMLSMIKEGFDKKYMNRSEYKELLNNYTLIKETAEIFLGI